MDRQIRERQRERETERDMIWKRATIRRTDTSSELTTDHRLFLKRLALEVSECVFVYSSSEAQVHSYLNLNLLLIETSQGFIIRIITISILLLSVYITLCAHLRCDFKETTHHTLTSILEFIDVRCTCPNRREKKGPAYSKDRRDIELDTSIFITLNAYNRWQKLQSFHTTSLSVASTIRKR